MTKKIGEGLKIFLLDDEKDACFFFKEFLVRRGFDVTTALSGQTAINLLKKLKPDIAILDIYLFKSTLNGIDVLKFIRENNPQCACVMVTRVDDQKLIEESKQLGAADYLIKPLTLDKIEKVIEKLVSKMKRAEK